MTNVEIVIDLLRKLYEQNAAGCCWHIVVDDGNLEDRWVKFSVAECLRNDHPACRALMVPMSRLTFAERQEVYSRYADYMG